MRTKKEIWEEVESNLEKGGEYKEDNNLLLFELLFDIRDALHESKDDNNVEGEEKDGTQ